MATPKKRKPGRPTVRTKEAEKLILDAVEKGASDKAAYLAAGISESTFYDWVRDEPEFSEAIAQARARAVMKAEGLVFGDNPLTWLTKGPGRKFANPDEAWSDAARVELSGPDGGPIRSAGPDLSRLSTEELRQLRELTEKAGGDA